jgi:uncharacterized protein (TIGR02145 family)
MGISCMSMTAQVAGISKNGDNATLAKPFLDQYGTSQEYPRLGKNGHILYYPALISTDSIKLDEVVGTQANVFAHISFDGWSSVTARGFDYSIYENFSPYTRISCGRGSGIYNYVLTSLAQNTTYYVRAYSQNSTGYSYGSAISIATPMGRVVAGNMTMTSVQQNAVGVRIPITQSGGGTIAANICAFPNDNWDPAEAICTMNPATSTFPINATIRNLNGNTSYYLRAIVFNRDYSDTTYAQVHTLSDLTMAIVSENGNPIIKCNDSTVSRYSAILSGTDPNKELYQFSWTTSSDSGTADGNTFTIHHSQIGSCVISVKAYYLADTIRKQITVSIQNPIIAVPTFCEDEFVATVSIGNYNATNYHSVVWINSNHEVVGTGRELSRFPGGEYKVIVTTSQNCVYEKNVWMGKRITNCPIASEPTLATEKAHLEEGVWLLDSVADHEGNWYAVTAIGNQCWTRQNLRTITSPKTGESFYHDPNVTGRSELIFPLVKYKSYDISQFPKYGLLYNLPAALDTTLSWGCINVPVNYRGICPEGWHLPKIEEFDILHNYVARQKDSVTPILPPFEFETGCLGTSIPIPERLFEECNPDLRRNYLYDYHNFSALKHQALFWTSSKANTDKNKIIFLESDCLNKYNYIRTSSLAVRCIRNE